MSASTVKNNKTICLTMIVKNESKIIIRLLQSVVNFIDCYCICDTGSIDNTQTIIEAFFKNNGVQGKIFQEEFKNFEYNRNMALKSSLGMSDYILLLDADMILRVNINKKSLLDMIQNIHSIYILQGSDDFYYNNVRIIKNDPNYFYVGVTHEVLQTPSNAIKLTIPKDKLFIEDVGDGGCKRNKFERDIKLLSEALLVNPLNDRYTFYLANSYHDTGKYEEAIKFYRKRISLKGWKQEVWYSHYRIGLCLFKLNQVEFAINEWLLAFDYYPERIENLYQIIKYYRTQGNNILAYQFYKIAVEILKKENYSELKDTFLFLHNDMYTHKLDFEYCVIAYYNCIKNIDRQVVSFLNTCENKDEIKVFLNNMKFYKCRPIPRKVIDLSISKHISCFGKNRQFISSSLCFIPSASGYDVNIRYVDYRYNKQNGRYIMEDNRITSFNEYHHLDIHEDFNLSDSHLFSFDMSTYNNKLWNYEYNGIDDVRIFRDHQGQLIFIGNHVNEAIRMVMGSYSPQNDILPIKYIIPTFEYNRTCEKNWVFVNYHEDTHIIYKWNPLTICKATENEHDYSLSIVSTKTLPKIFDHIRGSSCGFNYSKDDRKEIWFITHFVSPEAFRSYYHMFVVFDEHMNLLRYSHPFTFEKLNIEYCLSLIVTDVDVLLAYSTFDSTSKIAVYDKLIIDSMFL